MPRDAVVIAQRRCYQPERDGCDEGAAATGAPAGIVDRLATHDKAPARSCPAIRESADGPIQEPRLLSTQGTPLPRIGIAQVLIDTLNTTVRDALETPTKGEFCRGGEMSDCWSAVCAQVRAKLAS